jgi:hypothetical protein
MGGQGAFNGTQFVWWEKWLQIWTVRVEVGYNAMKRTVQFVSL